MLIYTIYLYIYTNKTSITQEKISIQRQLLVYSFSTKKKVLLSLSLLRVITKIHEYCFNTKQNNGIIVVYISIPSVK